MSSKTLLVMAGGTGGHVFPGLAVAQTLEQQGWTIHWLGTAQRMEADIVPKHGYPIHFVDVSGVRGNGLKRLLFAPLMVIRAIVQALKIIKNVKPNVVLGMGGYASGPGGVAAWLCGKPLILHEQNAVAGTTNRLLAPLARKILTGFAIHDWHKAKGKITHVGNPVRTDFANIEPLSIENRPIRILVTGGSLGAQALNQQMPKTFSQLKNFDFEVRHQTGRGKIDAVKSGYQSHCEDSFTWQAEEFVDDMVAAYAWADVIVCRAGALTVAEVALAGRCAIFVPLPHAIDDHQTKNADSLAQHEAALCIKQSELDEGAMTARLKELMEQPEKILNIAQSARKLAHKKATQLVADVCLNEATPIREGAR
ncbi:MAG: undecaprenyldiphospho-muramoylpentapeptide beta-N-acetylglucosaminyltransferase [Alteromonadaceae bacterium]|nr:undecaprenyldiphospho-muramoylpentapeptide beta-N-acetylglucosaminyltransferase [Alteromonadaceae bacterium]